jgi:hypothetical protein
MRNVPSRGFRVIIDDPCCGFTRLNVCVARLPEIESFSKIHRGDSIDCV